MKLAGLIALALSVASCAAPPAAPVAGGPRASHAKLMSWPDLLNRTRPSPTATYSYGADPLQVVDLWLPAGKAPHPTVLMVHGGCWQTEIADRTIMNWIADDLRKRGIAVWNIDYRGADRPGGGYPGTYQDVAAAADSLRAHAAANRLDLSRVVAVGHSAGGHLALWLAARPRLPANSALRTANPLPIRTVVSLGGLPDLERAARPPESGCGTEVIPRISGGRWAETSVPRLGPLHVRQVLVNGSNDRIIPNVYASDYAAAMTAKGERVKVDMIDDSGHVELIAPETVAWATAVREIERALRR